MKTIAIIIFCLLLVLNGCAEPSTPSVSIKSTANADLTGAQIKVFWLEQTKEMNRFLSREDIEVIDIIQVSPAGFIQWHVYYRLKK